MRVSLSINTFEGLVDEKVRQASVISKSSVHIDYSGDYDLKDFMTSVVKVFKISDLHVVKSSPYAELEELELAGLLPDVVFLQLENLEHVDSSFFKNTNIFPAICVGSDIDCYRDMILSSERILVMTTVPGVSGGVFNEGTYEFVEKIKILNPMVNVYVDGGVNSDNFNKLEILGVHTVIIGSYLAKSSNWKRNYAYLSNKVRSDVTLGSLAESLFELPTCKTTQLTDVLKVMSEFRTNFVLITNQSNEIINVITDGDVKRAVLSGLAIGSIDSLTVGSGNNFIYAEENECVEDLLSKVEIKPSMGVIPLMDRFGKFKKAIRIATIL